MFVLDTNVVSELRKVQSGRANPHVACWAANADANTLFISAITILEIEIGILRVERRDARQGAMLRAWLEDKVLTEFSDRTLPIDTAVAKRCASMHVPHPCSERDALIAATASVHGMTIVTENEEDFLSTGVRVFNPWLG
jgi:predicted nucleic acid-binding protein